MRKTESFAKACCELIEFGRNAKLMGTLEHLIAEHTLYLDDIFFHKIEAQVPKRTRELVIQNEELTERIHELEEKLHRSQEMLHLLMENISEEVFWRDSDCKYLGCNQSFAKHAGLDDPGEIIGLDDHQMPWKMDAVDYMTCDRQVIENNNPHLEYEDAQDHPERGFLWLKKNKLPLSDRNGNVIGLLGIIQDVTKAKHIKGLLINNELLLAEAQSIAHLGSWEYCLETDREYRSLEFFHILGIPAENAGVARNSMFDYIHPQDKERVKKEITETLEYGKPYDVEYRIIRADGIERTVHARGKTVKDENNRTTKFIGAIQDITERKQTEEALLFTQFSVDHAAMAIFWISEDGSITYCNNLACSYLGYSLEQLSSMTVFDVNPDRTSDSWKRGWDKSKQNEALIFETRHKTRDGEFIPVQITVKHMENRGREYYVAFVRDISQQKLAEENANTQLQRMACLRTIDTAITGNLDLNMVLDVILDQTMQQLGADAADIQLFSNAYRPEQIVVGRGFRTNDVMKTSAQLCNGLAGRVALEQRVLLIPDLRNIGGESATKPLPAEEEFVSYYGAPLIAKGKVVGVMEMYYRSRNTMKSEELIFFEALAKQTAIAVDNATLLSGLQKINLELVMAYDSTLEGWSRALDLRDKETEGHSRRVTELTIRLAMAMGVHSDDLIHIRWGAMLHDIGKMGVPDNILLKPGPLDAEERAIIEKHPVYAFELLSPIEFLQQALSIPYCHHEKWDGSGYPRKLSGERIPLAARIFAIADVWDALISDRPYRPALSMEISKSYILQQAGKQFDPQVVEIFMKVMTIDYG